MRKTPAIGDNIIWIILKTIVLGITAEKVGMFWAIVTITDVGKLLGGFYWNARLAWFVITEKNPVLI